MLFSGGWGCEPCWLASAVPPQLGEHVESLDKPVGAKVLHAMAQAFPDPVDSYLLSVVMGCDRASIESSIRDLVDSGLARARVVREGADERLDSPCITDIGMAVADGMADDAEQATAFLIQLEGKTLQQLVARRNDASRHGA